MLKIIEKCKLALDALCCKASAKATDGVIVRTVTTNASAALTRHTNAFASYQEAAKAAKLEANRAADAAKIADAAYAIHLKAAALATYDDPPTAADIASQSTYYKYEKAWGDAKLASDRSLEATAIANSAYAIYLKAATLAITANTIVKAAADAALNKG